MLTLSLKRLTPLSSLLKQAKKVEVIVTCDKGYTCDLINDSFFEPIIIASTNSSCSTSTSTSSTSDGFTCDATLINENETLKEVNELTLALGNAYGGEARLLKCLGSQRFSLNKEGLGYTPKKGKAAFATHNLALSRAMVSFAINARKLGTQNNITRTRTNQTMYPQLNLINGVQAKFIGAPIVGSKKKAIWVPKSLVTNLQGPKKVWVPKRN